MTPEKLNDESINEGIPASSCQAKVDSAKTRSALVKWLAATGAGAVTAAVVLAGGEPAKPVVTAGVPPVATMPAPTTRQAQLAGDIAPVRLVPPTTQPASEPVRTLGKPVQIRLEK